MDAEMVDQPDDNGADPAVEAAEDALSIAAMFDAVKAERDEFKDIALRLQADFENYKKRVATVQQDEVDRATGRLAESLLPVLDACEAAVAHGGEGAEAIRSSLMAALAGQGLVAMTLEGEPFDPEQAEAVVHEEGEGGDPVVVEVLRTGYTWKGRVLRAAMVKVRG